MKARRARLLAVLLLALLVAGDLIVEGYLDIRTIRDLRAVGARQNAIATEAADLLAVVQNFESAQRGYLLTERAEYLSSLEQSPEPARAHLQKLRELTASEPDRLARVEVAAALSETKIQEMTESVRLARAGHRDASIQLLQAGVGRDLMQRLRENVDGLSRPARASLQQIREELDRIIDRTLRLTTIKAILVALMVIAMFVFAMGEIRALERANETDGTERP